MFGGSAFFAADALGSTRGITGSTGAATDSLVYDAFGETLTRSGSTATPVQFAGTSGYQADAAGAPVLRRERGLTLRQWLASPGSRIINLRTNRLRARYASVRSSVHHDGNGRLCAISQLEGI